MQVNLYNTYNMYIYYITVTKTGVQMDLSTLKTDSNVFSLVYLLQEFGRRLLLSLSAQPDKV